MKLTALAGVFLYGICQWLTFLAQTVDGALADFGDEDDD